jgi:hypothetical protein
MGLRLGGTLGTISNLCDMMSDMSKEDFAKGGGRDPEKQKTPRIPEISRHVIKIPEIPFATRLPSLSNRPQ